VELPEPDFPTSAGRPWRTPDAEPVDRRGELAADARRLDDDQAAELAACAWRLWMAARDVSGGRAFLAEALDRPDAPRSRWRALALYGDGLLAYWDGDAAAARARSEEALEIAQELGDEEALVLAHLGLSRALLEQGDHGRAREHAVESRRHASQFGEAMGQAPMHMEAQAARAAGDYDEAAAVFEQSLALNRRIDDPSMVPVELQNLGMVEIRRGNVDAAERYFAELPPAADAYGRFNDAAVAFGKGDALRAQQLLAGVEDDAFASDDRADLDWLREQVACAVR
jgi:ATP/maltotriose-dependent transcriptional regulator MalT